MISRETKSQAPKRYNSLAWRSRPWKRARPMAPVTSCRDGERVSNFGTPGRCERECEGRCQTASVARDDALAPARARRWPRHGDVPAIVTRVLTCGWWMYTTRLLMSELEGLQSSRRRSEPGRVSPLLRSSGKGSFDN